MSFDNFRRCIGERVRTTSTVHPGKIKNRRENKTMNYKTFFTCNFYSYCVVSSISFKKAAIVLVTLWPTLLKNQILSMFFSWHKKMKFSIEKFFSKCRQIHKKLRSWSHLLKKSLMKKFSLNSEKFKFLFSVS